MTDNVNAEENVIQATAETAQAEENIAAAGLGKFKSVDALMNAYLSLEAEFTRRSQRLRELEEESKAQKPQSTENGNAGEEAPSPITENTGGRLLEAALADSGVREAVIG